jgi:hypothetical protein
MGLRVAIPVDRVARIAGEASVLWGWFCPAPWLLLVVVVVRLFDGVGTTKVTFRCHLTLESDFRRNVGDFECKTPPPHWV